MSDPYLTGQKYLTVMVVAAAVDVSEVLWRRTRKIITHYGGVAYADGQVLRAVFGLNEDKQEEQGLSACLSAQMLLDMYDGAARIALHGTYESVPDGADIQQTLLKSRSFRQVADMCHEISPGQILISAAAFDAVKNQTLLREIRIHQDGKIMPAYILRKIIDRNEPLFYTRHALNQPAPLIGRSDDLDAVLSCAREAFGSGSQHLHIEGEAGSGKTRLLHAAVDALLEDHPDLMICAAPSGRRSRAGSNMIQNFLTEICRQSGYVFDSREQVRGVLINMGLTNDLFVYACLDAWHASDTSAMWSGMSTAEQQVFQAELAGRLLAHIAHNRTVVVIFDDVHKNWDLSHILIQALHNNFDGTRLFVLSISKRPGLFKGLHSRVLHLQPLAQDEIRRIVRSVFAGDADLSVYIDDVTKCADGNPYFAVQLAQHIGRESSPGAGQGLRHIPQSLDAMFVAQLGGLEVAARDVLQACAVLGQKFWVQPLQAMLALDAPSVNAALDELEIQGFLNVIKGEVDEYEFTHDLTQEYIYRVLSRGQRQDLHYMALSALRAAGPDVIQNRVSHMAYHAFNAQDFRLAYAYGFCAGLLDLERCLPSHAEENLSLALTSLNNMQDCPRREARLARILLNLSRALSLTGKPRESREILAKISANHETRTSMQQRILIDTSIKWTLADCTYDEILNIETRISLDTPLGIGNAFRCAGILSDLGYFAESNARIATIFDAVCRMDRAGHFGMLFPAAASCLSLTSRNYAEMRLFGLAHTYALSALDEVERLFPPKKVYALAFSAVHHQRQGQYDQAVKLLEPAYFLAKEFQIGMIYPYVACNYAHALYFAIRNPAAFPIMRSGIDYAVQRDFFIRRSQYHLQYAEMLRASGQEAEAIDLARKAMQYACQHGEMHMQESIKLFLSEHAEDPSDLNKNRAWSF